MNINLNKNKSHSYFMQLALNQAEKVLGNTNENPSVGCVIVKHGNVIAAGSTSPGGRPHAERNAINFSKYRLKNSNIYITLEPCSHYGKTPPCVEAIIKNRIKKVFFSIEDPDLRSFSKSSRKLRRYGIQVKKGILRSKIKNFYKSYINFKKENLPYVTCKMAVSKDFFTINKKGRFITNNYSRGRVHLMRHNHDCLITSSSTVIKDNPRFTCRIQGLNEMSPSRIILDSKLKIKINSNVIKDASKYNTIIFFNKFRVRKIKLLKKLNITLFKMPLDVDGNLDLREVLIKAKKLGFSRIFVESGLKLSTSFLKKNLVNDFKLFISDEKIGKNGNSNLKNYFNTFFKNKRRNLEKINLFGEKLISYKLK